jgi:phage replication-related protein YjqB (UPF0714/DUF867 family)
VLEELLATPGVEEVCELRSTFGILAFHGGNLERGTDDIATAAAEAAGASLYVVRQPPDLRWHLPSVEFQPEQSAALASFVAHVDVAIAVHGYGRDGWWTTLLLGGRNRPLAARLATHLRAGLGGGFTIQDELEAIPRELRGVDRRNPVNLVPGTGVQLELPPRVRRGNGAPTFLPAYEAAVIEAIAATARGG